MSFFDLFTQQQSANAGSSSTVLSNGSWIPSTIGKSKRTIYSAFYNTSIGTPGGQFDPVNTFKTTSSSSNPDGASSILYEFDANGGNTVNLSNQIIIIKSDFAIFHLHSIIMTLKDTSGNFENILALNQNGTFTFNTGNIFHISTTSISSLQLRFYFSFIPSPIITISILPITSTTTSEPSGGFNIEVDGLISNTCGY